MKSQADKDKWLKQARKLLDYLSESQRYFTVNDLRLLTDKIKIKVDNRNVAVVLNQAFNEKKILKTNRYSVTMHGHNNPVVVWESNVYK